MGKGDARRRAGVRRRRSHTHVRDCHWDARRILAKADLPARGISINIADMAGQSGATAWSTRTAGGEHWTTKSFIKRWWAGKKTQLYDQVQNGAIDKLNAR